MNTIIKEDLEKICGGTIDWEKLKNSTVLISGAYGMLASYMVYTLWHLNDTCPSMNIRIIALCRDLKRAQTRFHDIMGESCFSVLCEDVTKSIKINEKVDYIIHAASPASSQFYGNDPVGVLSPNIFGTRNLLEVAREKKAQGFLFFSSGEVCGSLNKEVISEEECGYLDPTGVRNCYGESKRMGENMCACWHHQYNVPTFVVRPEHTYGPTMDLENDKRVFAEFVSDVVHNRDIVVKSDGLSVRTFCYISDATDGFFRVLLHGNQGESYNIGNMNGRMAIGDLAQLVVSLFPEKRLDVIYSKRQNDAAYLENKHTVRPMLSTAKLEKLGYQCTVSVRDGFLRTIQSFIKESTDNAKGK